MPERLQKFLARSGIGSRRFCESLIKSNKIFVNEKVATIGSSVREGDVIKYNHQEIQYTQEESEIFLLMLNVNMLVENLLLYVEKIRLLDSNFTLKNLVLRD